MPSDFYTNLLRDVGLEVGREGGWMVVEVREGEGKEGRLVRRRWKRLVWRSDRDHDVLR
jgi:hypothetical protein